MKSHARAFMAVDMLFGIFIITTISVTLLKAVQRENHAEIELSASRSAIHLAEHALLNLQHGQPLPKSTGDTSLQIAKVADGKAPSGFMWVKVVATIQKHSRSLIGIVPVGTTSSTEKNP